MKLIEAMKKIKNLTAKASDLRDKIAQHSADLSIETKVYEDQKAQVDGWLQAHTDILKEILSLRISIQRTNLITYVSIDLNDKIVTKTIAEWIHRRRDLAALELDAWTRLTDRNLKEQNVQTTPGGPVTEVRIRRYYDPQMRDYRRAALKDEPRTIDASLEIANATTELVLV